MDRKSRPATPARAPGAVVQPKKVRAATPVQRRYRGIAAPAAARDDWGGATGATASGAWGGDSGGDGFDWGASGGGSDPLALAASGVAGATQPLPFADTIQRSFGRHDVSGVRAATGTVAREASSAMGAEAYATGDRVAFGATPTLHTAAHEAAHVVQQRGGVNLKGGVGESGDAYEQHADRVADLVVRGASAETTLDQMAGAGASASTGTGGAVQRFDSPHHIAIGDSVAGESVTVHGVTFTPGQLAALHDYVGPLATLEADYTGSQLQEMQDLLVAGNESAADWDRVTNGKYSEITESNEDHFAPGDGTAANFEGSFIGHYSQALVEGARAKQAGESLDTAYLHLYSAEHYLHDAFSAGHQISADAINTAVDALLGPVNSKLVLFPIAHGVWRANSSVIQQYGFRVAGVGIPLQYTQFVELAVAGGLWKGIGGFNAGIRKYVHEELDHTGVEVASPAHPDPWLIHGDHSLLEQDENDLVSIAAMQAAMSELRAMIEINASIPTTEPEQMAAELFAQHRPVPTGDAQAAIDAVVAGATDSNASIIDAMVTAMSDTITGVMDNVAKLVPGIVKLTEDTGGDVQPFPTIPSGDAPPGGGEGDGESHIPEQGGDAPSGGGDTLGSYIPDFGSLYPTE